LITASHVKELSDLGDAPKLIVGFLADALNLCLHGEMAVKSYTKARDGVKRWDKHITNKKM
jgi:hypothetical protein